MAEIGTPDAHAPRPAPRGADLSRRFAGLLTICGLPLLLLVLVLAWLTYGRAEITDKALEHLVQHVVLVVGIVATFTVLALVVWRQFVAPAVALARYGAEARQGMAATLPDVPGPWLPLRAQIEAAIADERAKFHQLRAMIDGIPLRTVYVDHELIYRDANKEFLDFVGKSREEVIGHTVAEILGPRVVDQYEAMAERVQAGETMRWEGWIEFTAKGGRYLQVSLIPYLPIGATDVGFLTFTRDLTELKLGEQELARSEALNKAVVRASLDAIIVTDETWTILEFNPAAEDMSGYSRDEAIGMKVTDLVIPQDLREEQVGAMERFKTRPDGSSVARRFESFGVRKDGTKFPIEYSVNSVRFGEQRLFMAHARDLTEARRMAAEAEASRERLHQVEKLSAMGSLLAGVAHELNNPLAIVIAQSSLLVEKAPSEDVRRRGERIHAAAERCGRIVKSFLAMARQKPPQREPVDINMIAAGALDMVAYGLKSSDIAVEAELAPDLPAILGDRDLLAQVLANLLINAQQALTDRPAPRIVRLLTALRDGRVAVTVADNGPGVPEELRRKVFDPYFTTKPAGVGTGIGLSICRNVVEAHGGEVRLTSEPGGGARFDILLPVAAPAHEVAPAERPGNGRAGLDILIVDDEADVALSLAEIVEGLGHRPIVVDRSLAALERIGAERFDVVFADLRMPGLDGIDLRDRIHARDPALATRTVIVTGDTVAGPDRLARALGSEVVVLEKPFTFEEVRQVLGRLSAQLDRVAATNGGHGRG